MKTPLTAKAVGVKTGGAGAIADDGSSGFDEGVEEDVPCSVDDGNASEHKDWVETETPEISTQAMAGKDGGGDVMSCKCKLM